MTEHDITPTRDTIARAIFLHEHPGSRAWEAPGDGGRQQWWDRADAVLAVLPGRTEAQVKAEAWAEGYTSGYSRAMRCMSDEPNVPHAANPYRERGEV